MKILQLLITGSLIFISLNSYAQTSSSVERSNKLSVQYKGLSTHYYDGSRRVGRTQFADILKDNSETYKLFNSGNSLNTVGNIIGIPAGFVFGFAIGSSLGGGGKSNPTVLATSGLFLGLGLALNYMGREKIKSAVSTYNSKSMGINLNVSEHGMGIALHF